MFPLDAQQKGLSFLRPFLGGDGGAALRRRVRRVFY